MLPSSVAAHDHHIGSTIDGLAACVAVRDYDSMISIDTAIESSAVMLSNQPSNAAICGLTSSSLVFPANCLNLLSQLSG